MARTFSVDVRITDLPKVQQFNASVVTLLEALGECDALPEPVTSAMERLQRDVEALGDDPGPDPEISRKSSEEDKIREAMRGAQENPGRTVTAE
jgi:hypothetical protein